MRNKLQTCHFPLVIISLFLIVQGCSSTRNVSGGFDTRSVGEDTLQTNTGESEIGYKIRPGDELEILVWEQPSFNTLTSVSPVGTIAVPLVGEFLVAGRTAEELKRDLKRELSEFIKGEINITVSIRNTNESIVTVFGMVTRPDNYQVVDETTIFRILSSAGGPTEDANMNKVKLYRRSGPENYMTLDLIQYLEDGQMNSPNIVVRPGDVVYVPKKNNVVREMSEFLRDVVVLFGIFRVFD